MNHIVRLQRGVAMMCLFAVCLAGCGGIHRDIVYRPLAPYLSDKQGPFGSQQGARWGIELNGVELEVGPVIVSSRLTWVVGPAIAFPVFGEYEPREGPLEIHVSVIAKSGTTVEFDPREFTVVLETGRLLSPEAVIASQTEPPRPVTLSGGEIWRKHLRYGVPIEGLRPFTLRLNTINVDGESLRIPPISFVLKEGSHPS